MSLKAILDLVSRKEPVQDKEVVQILTENLGLEKQHAESVVKTMDLRRVVATYTFGSIVKTYSSSYSNGWKELRRNILSVWKKFQEAGAEEFYPDWLLAGIPLIERDYDFNEYEEGWDFLDSMPSTSGQAYYKSSGQNIHMLKGVPKKVVADHFRRAREQRWPREFMTLNPVIAHHLTRFDAKLYSRWLELYDSTKKESSRFLEGVAMGIPAFFGQGVEDKIGRAFDLVSVLTNENETIARQVIGRFPKHPKKLSAKGFGKMLEECVGNKYQALAEFLRLNNRDGFAVPYNAEEIIKKNIDLAAAYMQHYPNIAGPLRRAGLEEALERFESQVLRVVETPLVATSITEYSVLGLRNGPSRFVEGAARIISGLEAIGRIGDFEEEFYGWFARVQKIFTPNKRGEDKVATAYFAFYPGMLENMLTTLGTEGKQKLDEILEGVIEKSRAINSQSYIESVNNLIEIMGKSGNSNRTVEVLNEWCATGETVLERDERPYEFFWLARPLTEPNPDVGPYELSYESRSRKGLVEELITTGNIDRLVYLLKIVRGGKQPAGNFMKHARLYEEVGIDLRKAAEINYEFHPQYGAFIGEIPERFYPRPTKEVVNIINSDFGPLTKAETLKSLREANDSIKRR